MAGAVGGMGAVGNCRSLGSRRGAIPLLAVDRMSTGGSATGRVLDRPGRAGWQLQLNNRGIPASASRPAMSSNVHHLYLFFDTPLQLRLACADLPVPGPAVLGAGRALDP